MEGKVIAINRAKRVSGDQLPNNGDVMYRDYASNHEIDMYSELMACMGSGMLKVFPELKYREKYLSISIAPFSAGAVIVSNDITDRKGAEESEISFKHIIKNAPVGIFKREIEGKYDYFNQRLVLQFECKTVEEFLQKYGLVSQRWVHPEKHDEFKELLNKNRSVNGYEVESKLISGATKWFCLHAFLDHSGYFRR